MTDQNAAHSGIDPKLLEGRHPGVQSIARYFDYGHLSVELGTVSKIVADAAEDAIDLLPDGPELTTGLRKLLEAKDCLVRAALDG